MDTLQATVLRSILEKENWETLQSILKEDTFPEPETARLYTIIRRLHGEDSSDITISRLEMDIGVSFVTSEQLTMRDALLTAVGSIGRVNPEKATALKATLQRFISKSKALEAAYEIVKHNDDEDFDPAGPLAMLQEAVDLQSTLNITVSSFADAPPPGAETRKGVIGLGFSEEFDNALDGGIAEGEQAIILAPSGVGKTSFMWSAAAHAAWQGANVLGVSLEINEAKCFQRLDQSNTGMDKYELSANPMRAMSKRKGMPGEVWVQDWSHMTVTVDDLRLLVLQMRSRGMPVDYLMLDYMELVHPKVVNRNNPRFNYSQVSKDLRAVSNELGLRLLTAWQTNRAAADKHVLSKTDVGEDWGIVKNADIIIGLNQNPVELKDKIMRINILKQREGTRRDYANLHCDLDRMRIYPLGMYEDGQLPERYKND